MEKAKKIAVIAVFGLIIFGLALAHLLLPDEQTSLTERRKLAKFPDITAETVFDGDFSEGLEKYLLDHFPARNDFRTLKAVTNTKVLRLLDNNNLFTLDGGIYKLEYPLKEDQVSLAAKKFQWVVENFPEIEKAYYSVIPDKNYFTAAQNGYPSMDYEKLLSIMEEKLTAAEYIDIFDRLNADSYYRTDTHWRQESILPVVQRLCEKMGVTAAGSSNYKQNKAGEFFGVLYGQSALPAKPDSLVYLTSDATEKALVKSAEQEGTMAVYTIEKFTGNDPYDIFLSGAQSVITIENSGAESDRELVIFRDSFGSSIAPLLIDSYAKITLVDLRYISSGILSDYVDFEGADVLFLYSTMLLNAGGILK